jgi:hypothetical protein
MEHSRLSVTFAHKDWGGDLRPADDLIPDFIRGEATPPKTTDPDPAVVRNFIEKEFPGFLAPPAEPEAPKP